MLSPICFQLEFAVQQYVTCRSTAKPVHLPSAVVGAFCAKCCPVCKKSVRGAANQHPGSSS
jgi:hypothetical protein